MDNRTIREEIAKAVLPIVCGNKRQADRIIDALLPLITAAREEGATEPYEYRGFVIMNHVGKIWSPKVFPTEADALAYLSQQQREYRSMDLSKHTAGPGYSLTFALPPSQGAGS